MDSQVQWLRRYVAGRAARRLALESAAVGALWLVIALSAAVEPAGAALSAAVVAQGFAVVRLAVAIIANPVSHQYLMAWSDPAAGLEPAAPRRAGDRYHDAELLEIGLHHLVALDRPSTDPQARSPQDRLPRDRLEVYVSPSRLVLVSCEGDHHFTVVSKLVDGRILITTSEFVPPHQGALINHQPGVGLSDLVLGHVGVLDTLRRRGLRARRSGHELVLEQLYLEFQAWNALGPFVGPLLAVDPRRQAHLLSIRPPNRVLWPAATDGPLGEFSRQVRNRSKPSAPLLH